MNGSLLMALALASMDPPPVNHPICQAFEATVVIASAEIKRGERPEFTLVLRNSSPTPLRFLDARNGRRQSWGSTYYELVVRTPSGKDPNIATAIADPGPISKQDYFLLEPGKTAEIGITTPLALEDLRKGAYVAHVLVWRDPMDTKSICRSASVSLRVR